MSINVHAPKNARGQAVISKEAHSHIMSKLPLNIFIGEESIKSRYTMVRELIEKSNIAPYELVPLETIEFLRENRDLSHITVIAGNPNTDTAYKIEISIDQEIESGTYSAKLSNYEEFSSYSELHFQLFGFLN